MALAAVSGASAFAVTQTGPFSSPDTSAFLSVDLNGGPSSTGASASPTEGWNQSTSNPAFAADPYGVTWTPWGGQQNPYFGDNTQLPNSGAGVYATSISKTFSGLPASNVSSGAATVTISAAGTASSYGAVGTGLLDSIDMGLSWAGDDPSTGQPVTGPTLDLDMFRDFLIANGSGSNVQSSNYLQVEFTGLNKNSAYRVSLYSYNPYYAAGAAATATPPQTPNYESAGWWDNQTTNPGNESFTAPADEQTETWQTTGLPAAPAMLNVITNSQGNAYVWTWGGSGTTGDQNAAPSYLNGLQIDGGGALLLGDTNDDGKVDATDLATLQANMGQTFSGIYSRGYTIGDFNGDGKVDADDFALFQLGLAEYDKSQGQTVPEPSCLGILGLLAIAGCKRRKN
jgi:hypothetical protein